MSKKKVAVFILFEIFRSALNTLALLALCKALYLTVVNHRLHDDFAAAVWAHKFLCCNCGTRVFTGSCHD